MKSRFLLLMILVTWGIKAQLVTFSHLDQVSDIQDKRFYAIEDTLGAQYLGEIEVDGFSIDDALVFSKVYKKAKEAGANAFRLKQMEAIDGGLMPFNPHHYFIELYAVNKDDLKLTQNRFYVLGAPRKEQKIKINSKKCTIPERSFMMLEAQEGDLFVIGTPGLLGSSVKVAASEKPGFSYFQISGFRMRNNPEGQAGVNLKSGDVVALDTSYGMFLTNIYEKIKGDRCK